MCKVILSIAIMDKWSSLLEIKKKLDLRDSQDNVMSTELNSLK